MSVSDDVDLPMHQQAPQTRRGLSQFLCDRGHCSVGYRLSSPRRIELGEAAEFRKPHDRRFRFLTFVALAALGALILLGVVVWNSRDSTPGGISASARHVQPFDTLSNSEEARALARRLSNEIVNELGDSQIEIVMAEAGQSVETGLVVTGLMRDDTSSVIVAVRVEDGATRAALWSMDFKRGRAQRRTCQWKLRRALPTSPTSPFSRVARTHL